MIDPPNTQSFRSTLRAGTRRIGCFVKTPAVQVIEVLGLGGLDFAVLDAEHAPFGLREIDQLVPAARSAGLPLIVRVPTNDATYIAACLDLGVEGVLIPHVHDARSAEQSVQAVKFSAGKRGLSPSPRAAGYGTRTSAEFAAASDANTSVWCQIEDAQALGNLDAICSVPGVDCLFVGPVDLRRSLGCASPKDPPVREAIAEIAAAGRRRSVPLGIFAASHWDIPELASLGFTVFACGSDQSYLLSQARAVVAGGRAGHEERR